MYKYLENERLQLFFFSPNICATFLVVIVLLSIGLFLQLKSRKDKLSKVIVWPLASIIVFEFFMISKTYSRGGYIAAFAALAGTAILSRKVWSSIFLGIFSIILLLNSSGAERIKSSVDFIDGSIRNRFWLWDGACGIIAENLWSGLGAPPVAGNYYTAWYQPLQLLENYYTMISDYLTIATSYGIGALFLLLLLLSGILFIGIKIYLKKKNLFWLYTLAALGGYMVCAAFTTCYRFSEIICLITTIIVSSTLYIAFKLYHKAVTIRCNDILIPLLATIIVCSAIICRGFYRNSQLPYTHKYETTSIDNQVIRTLSITPRMEYKHTILMFCSDINQRNIRDYLRPLAENNFKVIAVELAAGISTRSKAAKFITDLAAGNKSVFALGVQQEYSLFALAGTVEAQKQNNIILQGVIVFDIPYEWPFDELSPVVLISELKTALIIKATTEDYFDNNIKLFTELKRKQIPFSFKKVASFSDALNCGLVTTDYR